MGKPQGEYPEDEQEREPEHREVLHDRLPPNLKTLGLQYYRSAMVEKADYDAELRGLLDADPNRHRALKEITVAYYHNVDAGSFPLALHSLDEYFKTRNIKFTYNIYRIDGCIGKRIPKSLKCFFLFLIIFC